MNPEVRNSAEENTAVRRGDRESAGICGSTIFFSIA
jgi:hypothetical protein